MKRYELLAKVNDCIEDVNFRYEKVKKQPSLETLIEYENAVAILKATALFAEELGAELSIGTWRDILHEAEIARTRMNAMIEAYEDIDKPF